MALYRERGGKKILMSPEEEAETRAGWAKYENSGRREEQRFEADVQEKIEKKLRSLAIKELKKEGELPDDYKDD